MPALEQAAPQGTRIAFMGRPNAGKSTLINRIIGEDRLLTGPEAGITRDSIGLDFQWGDRKIKLFDTAGLRRRARVTASYFQDRRARLRTDVPRPGKAGLFPSPLLPALV